MQSTPRSSPATVPETGAGARMDGAATPPPPPAVASAIERKLSPGVVLVIAILAMVFFIIGLLNLLVQNLLRLRRARRRRRQVGDADGSSPTAFQGQLGELFHLHDAGVDQASIDALPVFPYHAIAAANGGGTGGKGPFDCAVCLCEFAGDDKLRLLPTCGHAFHVPCIDAWLLSHSTCPLCRGSILAAADCSPPSSPSALLALEAEGVLETVAGDDSGDPGDRDGEEAQAPKDAAEEIVEVKLGKLRCVDGNASARDLAGGGTSGGDGNGRGNLGQRRCLSMGSYEYVMDEHAALRVAVPKRRAASSRSRRRHALSECEFGSTSKKGAWEAAVTEAAAGRCGGGSAAASLNRDSFSTSKIWMAPAGRREEDGRRRAAEPAAERRAASFRWPAMSAGGKKQHRGGGGEASCDVEAAGDGAPAPAEERPSLARAAMLWVAGGRQGSHS
ncbi:unnamed protein product [Urochloa decumbens]|uniref:RING-type E3 ubiquitin transferase n=1 Tax=Urochloa decumbens TaxID=240449 RepID=A0ABC9DDW1_9POAL